VSLVQELYDAQLLSLSDGRTPTFNLESTSGIGEPYGEDDPIVGPIYPTQPLYNEEVERTAWHHDLTFEDFMACFGGRDRSTIQVDSTSRPIPDMNFLEQEASTKLYDGANMSRLELCFWVLTLQSRHSLSNVCVDDILQGISDKVFSEKLNPNVPSTRAEARKVLSEVGLDYKMHALVTRHYIVGSTRINLRAPNASCRGMEPPRRRRLCPERCVCPSNIVIVSNKVIIHL
jgi:hypothetical protein